MIPKICRRLAEVDLPIAEVRRHAAREDLDRHATYNSAVGSMEARVLPAARRFKELRAATGNEIPHLSPVETMPRALTAPEMKEDSQA